MSFGGLKSIANAGIAWKFKAPTDNLTNICFHLPMHMQYTKIKFDI